MQTHSAHSCSGQHKQCTHACQARRGRTAGPALILLSGKRATSSLNASLGRTGPEGEEVQTAAAGTSPATTSVPANRPPLRSGHGLRVDCGAGVWAGGAVTCVSPRGSLWEGGPLRGPGGPARTPWAGLGSDGLCGAVPSRRSSGVCSAPMTRAVGAKVPCAVGVGNVGFQRGPAACEDLMSPDPEGPDPEGPRP